MIRIRALHCALALTAVLSLAACGSAPIATPLPPNAARGVYMSGGFYPVNTVSAIVLPDGRFFLPFGGRNISGLAVGQGAVSSGRFTGTYQFFGNPKYSSGTLNATYSSMNGLNGALSEDSANLTVAGYATPIAIYNPDSPPTLADFKGHWSGTMLGNQPFYVDVTSTGAVESPAGLDPRICTFSGSLSPDSAANYYHVDVTSAASVCNFPANATAIAVLVKTTQPDGSLWPQGFIFFTSPQGATVLSGHWDPNNFSPLP